MVIRELAKYNFSLICLHTVGLIHIVRFYNLIIQSPDPVIPRIRSGAQLHRICCRICATFSNERFYGDGFDQIKHGVGVGGDCSGKLGVCLF